MKNLRVKIVFRPTDKLLCKHDIYSITPVKGMNKPDLKRKVFTAFSTRSLSLLGFMCLFGRCVCVVSVNFIRSNFFLSSERWFFSPFHFWSILLFCSDYTPHSTRPSFTTPSPSTTLFYLNWQIIRLWTMSQVRKIQCYLVLHRLFFSVHVVFLDLFSNTRCCWMLFLLSQAQTPFQFALRRAEIETKDCNSLAIRDHWDGRRANFYGKLMCLELEEVDGAGEWDGNSKYSLINCSHDVWTVCRHRKNCLRRKGKSREKPFRAETKNLTTTRITRTTLTTEQVSSIDSLL